MTVQTRPGNVQPAEAGRADIGDAAAEVPSWRSVLSRLIGCPWLRRGRSWLIGRLLRERSRLAAGLLMAVAAVAAWPLTVVAGLAYAVAWRRGWPAARLGRLAGWALPMAVVWIAAESARGWRAMTLDPVRDGASGWPHLTAMTVARTFLLVAPVTIPTGLAMAALVWAWRIHTLTTGTYGQQAVQPSPVTASPPNPTAALPPSPVAPAVPGTPTALAARGPVLPAPADPAPTDPAPTDPARVVLPGPRLSCEPESAMPEPVLAVSDLAGVVGPGVRL